ncbi:TerD family protein [Paenibacillus sp. SYP-B4298]|uniref:TerD family protein n=1 Tax=Paenibacillus sp. SYP-B4298 TaxID=2996034 RepID=UPI0022DDCF46|nr:TerD family protein [Paenibacillus sp. SYP-B4298]
MINAIMLRRQRKWIVNPGDCALPYAYIATAMKNMESLGFTLSKPLMQALSSLSPEAFAIEYQQLIEQLRLLVGAHVVYTPMYPGFPDQVMAEGDAELYLNAFFYYVTLALPTASGVSAASRTASDHPAPEKRALQTIELGSMDELRQMIRQMIQASGSISQTDKEDIDTALRLESDPAALLPEQIPLKENVGFVTAALLRHGKAHAEQIARYFHTATDVLRLAVALSEGDVSLAESTRFRRLKRAERRLLLELLEQCGNLAEDMRRYKQRWIRLGEILHPGEYKARYPRCWAAFDMLRNDRPLDTFAGQVELALRWYQVDSAALLLAERPGEFARRLDHVLRIHDEPQQVLALFRGVSDQVATPVLLQLIAHFTRRHDGRRWRTFFPKGNVAKAFTIPGSLPPLDATVCAAAAELCRDTLRQRFAQLPPLGKVFVDEQLRRYMVPLAQRSASKSLRTLTRGSRIPMPPGDTIRFFLWWKEGIVNGKPTGRVDIDLSAILFDGGWQYMEHISYTNLRSAKYKAAHSGDIVSAPNGACEFIDLDIDSILEYGGRYVMASLNSFTSQPYCELPECFGGWMMRRKPGSGEVFEPSAVIDKVDVTANTQIAIPVILDLVERTVIWCDLALTRHPAYHNNVEGHLSSMAMMGQAMATLSKPDLYELFLLHATARGHLVGHAQEAETIFSPELGITPWDTERIMAEFIA